MCPVSIPIGELIVEGRAAVEAKHPRHWLIRLILNHALISPRRIQWFTPPLRWAQQLKLDRLGVALLGWIPKVGPVLKDLVQLAPKMPKPLWGELNKHPSTTRRAHSERNEVESTPGGPPMLQWSIGYGQNARLSAQDARHYRVGFFLGCVMNVAFADASRATVKVLNEFGCEVITPQDQMCCGAPQDDQGLKDTARKMAKQNIAAFEALGHLDAIVADCAACSGFLKEYERVFHGDVEWAERAARFSSKVRDITEWLDQIMPADLPLPTGERAGVRGVTRATYHEPCHLANVQGVRRQPRAVLARLKQSGVEMCELADSTRCCGSAGIYNLTHPALSKELLDRKMADVAATGAEIVVSANPGCLLQLDWGARRTGSDVKVKHVTQMVLETIEKRGA